MYIKGDLQQVETLGDQISYVLRLKIVGGIYSPGTKISENHLAKEFSTSRSPVRDALKMLANEGLIRLERMGAVVIGMDSKDLYELYEVRYLIESFALQRLASENDLSIISSLEIIIDKMEVAVKHKKYEEFAQLDFLFHETVITGINHNRITHLWKSIKNVVYAIILITTENRFKNRETEELYMLFANHKLMIKSLLTGSIEDIEETLKEHFSDVNNSLKNLL